MSKIHKGLLAAVLGFTAGCEVPFKNDTAPVIKQVKASATAEDIIESRYNYFLPDREFPSTLAGALEAMIVDYTARFNSADLGKTLARREELLQAFNELKSKNEVPFTLQKLFDRSLPPLDAQLIKYIDDQFSKWIDGTEKIESINLFGNLAYAAGTAPDLFTLKEDENTVFFKHPAFGYVMKFEEGVLSEPKKNTLYELSRYNIDEMNSLVGRVVTGNGEFGALIEPVSAGSAIVLGTGAFSESVQNILSELNITVRKGDRVRFFTGKFDLPGPAEGEYGIKNDAGIPASFCEANGTVYSIGVASTKETRDILKEAEYSVIKSEAISSARKGDFRTMHELSRTTLYGNPIISPKEIEDVINPYIAEQGNNIWVRIGIIAAQNGNLVAEGLRKNDNFTNKPEIKLYDALTAKVITPLQGLELLAEMHPGALGFLARRIRPEDLNIDNFEELDKYTTTLGSFDNLLESGAVYAGVRKEGTPVIIRSWQDAGPAYTPPVVGALQDRTAIGRAYRKVE